MRWCRRLRRLANRCWSRSPALAEVLATPDCDMEEVLSTLRGSAYIRIGDFDQRAAVELAVRFVHAYTAGDIREGLKDHEDQDEVRSADRGHRTHQRARVLYSDDDGVKSSAEGSGLKVKRTSDLPIPAIQQDLFDGGRPTQPAAPPDAGKPAGPEPKSE